VDGYRIPATTEERAPLATSPALEAARLDVTVADALPAALGMGLLAIEGVDARAAETRVRDATRSAAAHLHARWPRGEPPPEEIALRFDAFADALASTGDDPDEHTFALETLLERLASGAAFPRTDPVSDAVAVASLETLVPATAHDLARTTPPFTCRTGAPRESYPAVGRADAVVEGRPVLADAAGPFASPTAQAVRTRPTVATDRLLVVAWLPEGAGTPDPEPLLDALSKTVTGLLGGREVARRIL
jgi:DNA/RNA-binding domain of Phe-tRNA-synthetase-like protein